MSDRGFYYDDLAEVLELGEYGSKTDSYRLFRIVHGDDYGDLI